MIPLEKELVKCKCICTLSAPSFLPGEIIICDFYKISGENFLRIYMNADTAMAGLRKSIKAYTDEGKSVDEALALTIDSIKNAETETEALSIAQEIFGTKGSAEMVTAIREGRMDLESLSASMEEYGNVVEDTFNATQDPWDEAKIATNNLKLAAADLGTTVLSSLQPTITKVVTKVKEFTQWFRNLSDSQKETIIKIAVLVAAIGPALIIFGKLSTGISNVIGVVTKLKGAMGAGGGLTKVLTMLTGPVGIAIAIIAALAAGFIALYKTNDEFREKVDNAMAKVKQAFSDMWNKVQPIIEQIKQAFLKLRDALQPIFEFLITCILAVANGMIAAADSILSAVQNGIDFITNIVKAFTALLQGDFSGFFEYIQAALQNAIDFCKNIIKAVVDFIIGFFEAFGVDVKKIFSDIWNGIQNIFQGVGQWFLTKFEEAYQGVVNAFSNVVSFFSGLWEKIKGCFVDVGLKIGSAVGDGFKTAINGVLSTIEGIINGFIGMINGVIGIINNIPGVSLGTISELSLPRLAKGGVLREGQAMVAEAGPELLSMVNGKAVVTPLTNGARNQAADALGGKGGDYHQTINITSPKALTPYEVGRQTRIQTRGMVRTLQLGRV